MTTITKPKLLLIIGIAIAAVSLGLGAWAATITTPTSIKIIQCMREKDPNQTFTGLDTEGHFEDCASQYPLDPTAALVLGISNLLFWAGIIIIVVAISWIVRDWYIDRKATRRSIRTRRGKK
ncbi:MAG TPA: hypothetical protein VKA98_02215 [Nitrososphaeraceae archaeon]|nr:hypothetical protein [Nitrososphaeraceae archaeon]